MKPLRYPNIEAERVRLGYTQDEFAKELGVVRKTLYNWTHSGRIPRSKIIKISALTGKSVDYLLNRT